MLPPEQHWKAGEDPFEYGDELLNFGHEFLSAGPPPTTAKAFAEWARLRDDYVCQFQEEYRAHLFIPPLFAEPRRSADT